MTPTVPHILLSAHGSLPGNENWSCGLRTFRTGSFLSEASGAALALAAANRWRTFQNTAGSCLGQGSGQKATLDGVTVREINDQGVTQQQYESSPSTGLASTEFTITQPNQSALAVTLLTARAGRTGKGRIYLPLLAVAPGSLSSGQLLNAFVTALMSPLQVLFDGLNTDLSANFGSALKLAVQSPKAAADHTVSGLVDSYDGAVITGFKVGSVIDTQRRRRNSIPETYITSSVA